MNTVTATGTLEEVVTRAGFDESALFVHVRFPSEARKFVLTCPTGQVLDDDLYPGTEVILDITQCGFAEYVGRPTPPCRRL